MLISLCACLVRFRPVLSPASTEDCAFEKIGTRSTAAQAALPKVHRVRLIVIQSNLKSGRIAPRFLSRGYAGGSRGGGKSSPVSPNWHAISRFLLPRCDEADPLPNGRRSHGDSVW